MKTMLGIKLDSELERRVADFARARGQAKSEVGRRALVEYLDRHSLDEEFRRQLSLIRNSQPDDMDELERMAFDHPEWR